MGGGALHATPSNSTGSGWQALNHTVIAPAIAAVIHLLI